MSWRVARSLLDIQGELNKAYPERRKTSDGFIGDADHQSRTSDHNPWVPPPTGGVVTAGDFTHDPSRGLDSRILSEYFRTMARSGKDKGILKYIICTRRIASSRNNWAWRPYNGINAHLSHVHVSVTMSNYDKRIAWGIAPVAVSDMEDEVISKDTHGGRESGDVKKWQYRMNQCEFSNVDLVSDGYFGDKTEKAVEAAQQQLGLDVTGTINFTTAIQIQARAHGKGSHS